ncbi:hypothetical protein [Myxococcus qinghaiensis]|uniref:hypothetical protein n=1 Tax=Myxococcus qinghaiensis TaxID=2906758 RepID=UPI0020A72CD2|nr:hypothetical protein [Myxococcus qinghaiensis]MCP3170155.1 hypothetical protein [Myxococcus qinghaiensis]
MRSLLPPAVTRDKAEAQRLRREDAVDVLTEALWELWVRQHARPTQKQAEKEDTHG